MEDGALKLTVQLPSRFYYEWLEEHYFALLRKTITKVLGPGGRLFAVVGELPVMTARLIRSEAPGARVALDLFETVVAPLINALAPARFEF